MNGKAFFESRRIHLEKSYGKAKIVFLGIIVEFLEYLSCSPKEAVIKFMTQYYYFFIRFVVILYEFNF